MLKSIIRFLFGYPTPQALSSSPVDKTEDRIRRCPWPNDIHIERSSWTGTGAYDSIAGRVYRSVACAADGPNNDADKTFHHGYIGHWSEFISAEAANAFATKLYSDVIRITGVVPPLYVSHKDLNNHARWCMGEIKKRPVGIQPHELPVDLKPYA